ncbi:MAG: DHH family phosphoesterase [Puniceicoccales bacterium]|jgi:phosphoesterase RecJ-like protein|nr:DHH family phosphoesterase [Puniceicoccales bacterium]
MRPLFYPTESAHFQKLLASFHGKRVAVIGHLRPDGDCIGSQVALCRILRSLGTDAVCVNGHTIPANLQAFVGDTPFVLANNFTPDGHEALYTDCADLGRAGDTLAALFPEPAANIDHHISNTRFARENIVLPDAAAVCAMLAAFVSDSAIAIDAVTAQALYTGIVTDTGQFKYPSTTPEVLEAAAGLLRRGACVRTTTDALYEHSTFAQNALLQRFLASLRLEHGGRVCIGETRLVDFEQTGTSSDDTEDFNDYPRCIDGVDIAVTLEEQRTSVKGSLRAKDGHLRMDVLGKALGGGGHVCAAGFRLPNETLESARAKVLATIATHLENL